MYKFIKLGSDFYRKVGGRVKSGRLVVIIFKLVLFDWIKFFGDCSNICNERVGIE